MLKSETCMNKEEKVSKKLKQAEGGNPGDSSDDSDATDNDDVPLSPSLPMGTKTPHSDSKPQIIDLKNETAASDISDDEDEQYEIEEEATTTQKTKDGYVFDDKFIKLPTFADYADLMSDVQKYDLYFGSLPAQLPPPGAVVAYSLKEVMKVNNFNRDRARRECRVDGYAWTNSGGHKSVGMGPKCEGMKQDIYYSLNKDTEERDRSFARYEIWKGGDTVLFHYIGEKENAAINKVHGNSKRGHPFVRVLPSQIDHAKELTTKMPPQAAKNHDLSSSQLPPEYERVGRGQNDKFYQNRSREAKLQMHLTMNETYNVLKSIQMLKYPPKNKGHPNEAFVQHSSFTDDGVVLHLECMPLFYELEEIIETNKDLQILLNYDTTFSIGDFYTSVLTFKHPYFNKLMPLAVMVHTKKTNRTHSYFFQQLYDKFEFLADGNFMLVTDQEFAKGIAWPNAEHAYCYIHLLKNYKATLKEHKYDKTVIKKRKEDWRELQQQETKEGFDEFLKHLIDEYKDDKIGIKLIEDAAKTMRDTGSTAALRSMGITDLKRLTSNMAESMNKRLKATINEGNFQKLTVDLMIYEMYYLFNVYRNKLNRWYHKLDNVEISYIDQKYLKGEPDEVEPVSYLPPPSGFAKYFLEKGGLGLDPLLNETDDTLFTSVVVTIGETHSEILNQISWELLHEKNVKDAGNYEYIVLDKKQERHLVYPNEPKSKKKTLVTFKCTCRATRTCVHVRAVEGLLELPLTDDGQGDFIRDIKRDRPKNIGPSGQKRPIPFYEGRDDDIVEKKKPKEEIQVTYQKVLTKEEKEEQKRIVRELCESMSENFLKGFPPEKYLPLASAAMTLNVEKNLLVKDTVFVPTAIQPLPVLEIGKAIFAYTTFEELIFIVRNDKTTVEAFTAKTNPSKEEIDEIKFLSAMTCRDIESRFCKVFIKLIKNHGINGINQNILLVCFAHRVKAEDYSPEAYSFDMPTEVTGDEDAIEKIYNTWKDVPGVQFQAKSDTDLYCCCKLHFAAVSVDQSAKLFSDDQLCCSNCNTWYFAHCVNGTTSLRNPRKFECYKCIKKVLLLPKWGSETATMTCPLDNFLAACLARLNLDNNFEKMISENDKVNAFERALLIFLRGNYKNDKTLQKAKDKFVKSVFPGEQSLYGTENRAYLSSLRESQYGILIDRRCKNCSAEIKQPFIHDLLTIDDFH